MLQIVLGFTSKLIFTNLLIDNQWIIITLTILKN